MNVRLDAEHVRKVRALRERGIGFSDLVRQAIDATYEAAVHRESSEDVDALISLLFATYPDPADLPLRDYDVHDREAASSALRRRLRGTSR